MMICKNKSLLLFFLFFSYSFFSQEPETIKFDSSGTTLLNNWELYLVQNQNSTYYDAKPQTIYRSFAIVDSFDLTNYKGVCWFRKRIKADTSRHITLEIHLIGAAELFFDGKKIKNIGTVADNEIAEKVLSSVQEYATVILEKNKTHELLIRFSNHNLDESYNSIGLNVFGTKIYLKNTEAVFESQKEHLVRTVLGMVFMVFFFSLSFVHFLIYLFNKKEVANLYYSGFCFFATLFTFSLQGSTFISDALVLKYTSFMILITATLGFGILPYMFRSFFKMQIPKWYRILLVTIVLCLASFLFLAAVFGVILLILIILFGIIESVRATVKAFRQKLKGVKIIGSGLALFSLFTATMIFSALSGGLSADTTLEAIILISFLVLSIISIPVSITVFLAYDISLTNKSLSKKLVEVEELSAKSIEQEKEKQHILENQKTVLEQQVKERTFEITEQKKIIEEKNKDIIDSINYAKRIQSAMLPQEEEFKRIFKDSFVLYQPRDIVSGDFYYATEVDGKKLIIAADCTGHGVPGALMSMVGCNIINKLVHENTILNPKEILERLHIDLRHALKQDTKGSVNRDGMDIAVIMISSSVIQFASANRPVIWFDHNNQLNELKPTKTPVGGSHIERVDVELKELQKKDVKQFFMFSDGFADQFGGPEGKKLMISRFKQWLRECITKTVSEQHHFLKSNFADWKKETEQVDDVLVIGIKIV